MGKTSLAHVTRCHGQWDFSISGVIRNPKTSLLGPSTCQIMGEPKNFCSKVSAVKPHWCTAARYRLRRRPSGIECVGGWVCILRINVIAGGLGALCKAPSLFTRSRARPGWGASCKASQGGFVVLQSGSGRREGDTNVVPLSRPPSCETGAPRFPSNDLWETGGGPSNDLWARPDRLENKSDAKLYT